ncbi:MAG: nucleotidyltransferase domain-containing protein [bacterium]
MLTRSDQEAIESIAREFHVKKVWLFGSSLHSGADAADIDIAVEGVPEGQFFKFYARIMWSLSKPVDIVDMSDDLPIVSIIRKTGRVIYG